MRKVAGRNEDSGICSELVARRMDGCLEHHARKEGYNINGRGQGESVE
jgi:hypothetical protein